MDNITPLQFTPGEINESRTDLIWFLTFFPRDFPVNRSCRTATLSHRGLKRGRCLWSCAVNKDKRVKSSHSAPAKRKKVSSSAMVSHVDWFADAKTFLGTQTCYSTAHLFCACKKNPEITNLPSYKTALHLHLDT